MTWDSRTSHGSEQDKIAHLLLPYVQGKALDLGCGTHKAWPPMIGVDNGGTFGHGTEADVAADISDLSLFADESVDAVFSSHALEDFPEDRVEAVLAEWARVVRVGGYLCLYVPSANLYPLVGEEGANPAHQWNIYPGDIERHLLAATSCGWTQVECEERAGGNEYSLWEVYRKRDDGEYNCQPWQRNPEGQKRALVIRLGAIGDQIVASSILPELKKQGYHITYNTTPEAQAVMAQNPFINEWLIQAKDFVPNPQLGPLWEAWAERYDKIINLCESVEGALLTIPDRLNYNYSHEARKRLYGGVNYLERTHDIAGVPHVFHPKFYPNPGEECWAEAMQRKIGRPTILWAVHGSSPHKVYPWTHVVTKWLVQRGGYNVVLTGDPGIGKQVQDGLMVALERDGVDMTRVLGTAGDWTLRQVLTFAQQQAACVVGPETGVLNAVCRDDVPKVIYLSHSSPDNLTKHWLNTTTLTADTERAPCHPCHQLHPDWTRCPQSPETHAALCASAIAPDAVFSAIVNGILSRQTEAA